MAQRDLFRSPPPAWNARRIIGPKPPFKPKHVWAIRQQLRTNGRVRDLALFDCGIDAKLRGCDLVKLRVSDVAPGGVLRQRDGHPAEDRQAGAVLDHRSEARGADGVADAAGPSRRRLAIPQPEPPRRAHQHPPVRAAGRSLGGHDRLGAPRLWHPQPAPDQGGAGVQEDGQPARLSAPARSSQAGKHRALPRHRGRRRARPLRAGGSLSRRQADAARVRHGW